MRLPHYISITIVLASVSLLGSNVDANIAPCDTYTNHTVVIQVKDSRVLDGFVTHSKGCYSSPVMEDLSMQDRITVVGEDGVYSKIYEGRFYFPHLLNDKPIVLMPESPFLPAFELITTDTEQYDEIQTRQKQKVAQERRNNLLRWIIVPIGIAFGFFFLIYRSLLLNRSLYKYRSHIRLIFMLAFGVLVYGYLNYTGVIGLLPFF